MSLLRDAAGSHGPIRPAIYEIYLLILSVKVKHRGSVMRGHSQTILKGAAAIGAARSDSAPDDGKAVVPDDALTALAGLLGRSAARQLLANAMTPEPEPTR